ncbi:serine/threonine-protein kinase [Acaryochloris marina]|uniref:serine/threonine-protein kinase n=1 Tax=Acaryochloris marina TaxID=155978 RepID=UPI001BAEA4BD|nr:serine/threonine-protein kinase [Acaryochloris marina]QUY45720.1 tetratricopeptide repeat protein [Acaryochloris marina S15]
MSYCPNPICDQRLNPDQLDQCQNCGASLLIGDRYRLLKPLGDLHPLRRSEVFEAQAGDEDVKIIKILKDVQPKLVTMFEREYVALRSIRHPCVPRAEWYEYFKIKLNPLQDPCEIYGFVMEKIEGVTLKEWLKTHDPVSPHQAFDWLKQLAQILHAIHEKRFFHRDIKPSNIIVRPDGKLALIDLGAIRPITETYIAKLATPENTDGITERFDDITLIQSMGYSPLEQVNGKALPQSDFYALGRTIIEVLTGVQPYKLPIDKKTGEPIWRDKLPRLDRKLANLLDKMMAIQPGDRHQSTKYLLQDIEKLELWEKASRSPYFKLGLGVFAVCIAVLGYVGIKEGKEFYSQSMAEHYFYKGYVEQSNNQLSAAKENYAKALNLNPNNEETLNNLGIICQVEGDLPCAIENYKKAAQVNSSYWISTFNLASLYEDQGNATLAEKYYRRVIENATDAQAVGSANNLSRLKILQGNYAEAKKLVTRVVGETAARDLDRALLLKNLGWAEFKLEQHEQAEDHLKQATSLDPEMAAAHCLIAQVYQEQGKQPLAQKAWKTCLQLDSSLPEVDEWKSLVLNRLFPEP